jgi:beta-glucanase (GH16 family)
MHKFLLLTFLFNSIFLFSQSQTVEDDFEGNGTINWEQDPTQQISFDVAFPNQNPRGINTSATVLKYNDDGIRQYANIRFNTPVNFDLSTNHTFSLKIYIPSSGITGSQPNQISLKLQDGNIGEPWRTQSEIIKPVSLNTWQEVIFDFSTASPNPTSRTDFNRIVLQVNGENNNDQVIAYIDDFLYDGTIDLSVDPVDPVDSVDPVYNNLVWSDEFDGNGAINSSNWFHQTQLPAGGNWYNGEVQHYTDRTENSYVSDGTLKIVAKKESFPDQGYTKQYTSARLNSKFAFKYGRVEVRAKLPTGVGTWPAIWMLGKNINEDGAYWDIEGFGTTNWPACGEIDIMEHWGSNQNFVQSAMHTPSSFGSTINHGGQIISTASTEFHTYTLEWSPTKMVFSVDGKVHYTYNPATKNSSTWPFDADQYMLLNVAIQPSIEASFVQSSMEIDYVRVYQESTASVPDENRFEGASLYPNPVKDNLTIQVPTHFLGAKATIYSILGQELNSFVQKESRMNIDLSHYEKGVYILRFEANNKIATYEILKM